VSFLSDCHVEVHNFGVKSDVQEYRRPNFGKDLSGVEA
jgi:hypothetical protein